ncbi:MAG: YraN family protein, partial [Betaproteobacteria bacterium]|nr:YraN family protein [Betaproteobacteria bacterium]
MQASGNPQSCALKSRPQRGGEIDLVMRAGSVLVFVEVRYRSSQAFGGAIESLGRQKQARIRHAAACFLKRSFGDSHWPA